MRLRLGLVGCGGVAQAIHLPVLSTLIDRFQVVAVADQRMEHAATAACRYGIPSRFDSAQALVQEVAVDALVVLTPSHEDDISLAIDRGLHVFTEKPLSLDVDRSSLLCERAARAGVVLEVGLMRLHDRALQAAHAQVSEFRPRSAFFTKCDGSDAARRREMLPVGTSTYTFEQSRAPNIPEELSEKQVLVLKQLLWSGTHLLTALVTLFPGARPRNGALTDGGSVHCTFTGATGEALQFSLLTIEAPIYLEEIRLFTSRSVVTVEFDSPYQHPGRSCMTVHEGSAPPTNTCRYFEESAFRRMWEGFHRRLTSQEHGGTRADSAVVECRIERLALDVARLTS